jgi:hypothetical protein
MMTITSSVGYLAGRLYCLILMVLLLLPTVILTSCAGVPNTAKSIVQVWESDTLVASGVAVGDGTQVLAVLDYIHSPTKNISIATGDGTRYQASIAALDPRTSVTLLKVKGIRLLTDSLTGSQTVIEPGQSVIVLGWFRPVVSTEKQGDNIHEVLGNPKLRKTRALVGTEASGSPHQFNLQISSGYAQAAQPGDVVTGRDGEIIGLVGNWGFGPIPAPVPQGYIPPVVTISSALELLSADYQSQSWAEGPVGYAILAPNSTSAYLKVPDNYQAVSDSILQQLNTLGKPVSLDDIRQTNPQFVFGPKQGKLLVAIFAFPVELRSKEGTLMATGRWIGIAWNRFDQPGILFYGKEGPEI